MIRGPHVSPTVRAGIVANPTAGLGPDTVRRTVRRLLGALAACGFGDVLVLDGSFSAEAAATPPGVDVTVVRTGGIHPTAATVAEVLLEADVNVLIGVGGDGTLADVATAILRSERPVPLLGVGVGSSNVGPLISIHGSDLSVAALASLDIAGVHGIEAFRSTTRLGVAFNDVVFSNLYFGTRDGTRVDLDADARLQGEDCLVKPHSVCNEDTYVAKNGNTLLDGRRHRLAQIIASPLNDPAPYAGKAVSGLMSWGPYLGRPAVLAGISEVAIRTRIDDSLLNDAEPLGLYHVCFGPDDTICIGGLDPTAVVVLDGNPVLKPGPGESIVLRLRLDVLRVLRTPGSRSIPGHRFPACVSMDPRKEDVRSY